MSLGVFFPAMAQRPGDVIGIEAYKMVVEWE
jgi:hypothetical protein